MKEFHFTRNGAHHTSRVDVVGGGGPKALPIHNLPGASVPISPDGHAWGYGGSGPTQLAIDLLWEVYDRPPAPPFYRAFTDEVLARISQDIYVLTEDQVRNWERLYDGEKWLQERLAV